MSKENLAEDLKKISSRVLWFQVGCATTLGCAAALAISSAAVGFIVALGVMLALVAVTYNIAEQEIMFTMRDEALLRAVQAQNANIQTIAQMIGTMNDQLASLNEELLEIRSELNVKSKV